MRKGEEQHRRVRRIRVALHLSARDMADVAGIPRFPLVRQRVGTRRGFDGTRTPIYGQRRKCRALQYLRHEANGAPPPAGWSTVLAALHARLRFWLGRRDWRQVAPPAGLTARDLKIAVEANR